MQKWSIRLCTFWEGSVLSITILGVTVTSPLNWGTEGPEDLGGALQAGLELRMLLPPPHTHTALGQLPGMGGRQGRGLGQG